MRKIKFLLDENLGKLAKWLRFLGYNAAIYKSISIHNKIRIANKENRIYLTRNKKLIKLKQKFPRKLITSENYKEQLRELKNYISFDKKHLFTVCPICNKPLKIAKKENIKNLVPEFIYKTHDDFKVCYHCGRVFWQGSHFKKIEETLKEILNKTK